MAKTHSELGDAGAQAADHGDQLPGTDTGGDLKAAEGLAPETMMGLAVGRPNEITLAIRPVQRFAILRAIRTQIRAQASVVDVRLEQLERGVAVFRIRHLGTMPVAESIADALEPLGLDVSSVSAGEEDGAG